MDNNASVICIPDWSHISKGLKCYLSQDDDTSVINPYYIFPLRPALFLNHCKTYPDIEIDNTA